jgi:phenylpropionate dioxygenase-like ring-hydroxylating dioxygenase large terminal subunit
MAAAGPTAPTGRYSVAFARDGWHAIARSEDLAGGPLARTIFDLPVVLFRDREGRAATLLDRCAHRNAPLSLGAVDAAGHLACPYHGWRFDGRGACRDVPGLLGGEIDAGPRIDACAPGAVGRNVPAFATAEQDGFVWIWGREDAEPRGLPMRIPHAADPDYLVVLREYDVECTLHAALENALDVPHTAFVHRGDFRGKESREIEAIRRRIAGGVEVEYLGEPPLSGPMHDAAGAPIVSEHWDRFFLPGIAQVEYKTSSGRHQISTLPHCPVSAFRTRFWLVSCWKVPPARRAEMEPVIAKQLDTILGQDLEILRQQTRRIRELGGESYRSTPLDLMGPEILRMLRAAERGEPTDEHAVDRTVRFRVF